MSELEFLKVIKIQIDSRIKQIEIENEESNVFPFHIVFPGESYEEARAKYLEAVRQEKIRQSEQQPDLCGV